MKATLVLEGATPLLGSPVIMHSERLADPLDDFTRAIAAISKKRNKTEADHLDIARLEFLGGMYTDDPNHSPDHPAGNPVIPAWNIIRCLQDGAKRHKRGPDVLRGITPLAQHAELSYDGDTITDPEEMWKAGRFALRKTVGVQRSRTVRTRPIFHEWRAELPIEVDLNVWDLDTLANCWTAAGTYAGIGDMRPIYGRFQASVVKDEVRGKK